MQHPPVCSHMFSMLSSLSVETRDWRQEPVHPHPAKLPEVVRLLFRSQTITSCPFCCEFFRGELESYPIDKFMKWCSLRRSNCLSSP